MLETAEITSDADGTRTRPVLGDISAKLAGIGGIGFAAIVVLQNIIRGGSAPANGATTDEVLTHYADHRAITFVLVATFVLSGAGMAIFLGGAMRRLMASERRGWALTGFAGATGILALFSVVVGCEQALSVVASGDHPNLGAIEALWALHNSVFTVLDLFIAAALLGLSRAGIAAGLTPRAFRRLAPIGSALLLVGTFAGPAIAAGDAMPLFG
ncbi:MAG: hypothetical protein ACXWZX_10105, partial [Mycobacterium sp.]